MGKSCISLEQRMGLKKQQQTLGAVGSRILDIGAASRCTHQIQSVFRCVFEHLPDVYPGVLLDASSNFSFCRHVRLAFFNLTTSS